MEQVITVSSGKFRRTAKPSPGAAAEDRRAFEELYHATRDDLFAYLAYLVGDRATAEDVFAQALERAFRARAKFDADRGDRRAWLYGIARNAALDELRRRKRFASLTLEVEDVPDRADYAGDSLLRVTVAAALSELDPRRRELVALKFFAGLGNAEIGRVLGLSESNVGTRLHRAIGTLRAVLDENIGGGER